MIGYVMVGTNNLDKSISFYDSLLELLNLKRVDTSEDYAGYASKNNPKNIEFYIFPFLMIFFSIYSPKIFFFLYFHINYIKLIYTIIII